MGEILTVGNQVRSDCGLDPNEARPQERLPVLETVFMFSGQGSQYFQMGRELHEGNETFRRWMARLDAIAREMIGQSVIETLYSDLHGRGDLFDRTLLTHPAIFMVEFSLAQVLMEAGMWPSLVLGVSLGSFAAAAVAGFVSIEDSFSAVLQQAILLEECCETGGMIAILADPVLFAESFLNSHSELAAVNLASHFVVSAPRMELAEIEGELKRRHVEFQRLPVTLPFHSRWIEKAKTPFQSFMLPIRRKKGRLPLMCSAKTERLSDLSDDFFWNVVRHPIRFRETAARVEEHGARRYIDVGPSGTLATFLRYGLPATSKSTVHSILTPFGFDRKNLSALLASTRP